MREPPAVSLVCCDLASLVIDGSIVERAFAEAIATQGIVVGTQDYVRSMVRLDRARGRPPADVLQEIFDGEEPRAQAASLAFDRSFRAAAERYGMTVPPDVVAALTKAAASGAKVCLLSGLSGAACRRPPRRAVPPGHRGPGAVRGRRAARLPVAGPRAHRDAAARNARRPGGRDGQRHRERPAVRLAGRRQDRSGNRHAAAAALRWVPRMCWTTWPRCPT